MSTGLEVWEPSPLALKRGRYEVPLEAVIALQGVWTRYKMAGIELGCASLTSRRLGLATTLVTAVTSLAIFTTLQANTSTPARILVGVVVAGAAVLSTWQTYAAKQAESDRAVLQGIVDTFMPLRTEFLHAVSQCQAWGLPIDPELLARAQKALDSHGARHAGEYPSFDEAERKVRTSLVSMGLLNPQPGAPLRG